MSFRSRLLLSFCAVVLLSLGAAVYIFDEEVKEIYLKQYRAKLLSVAASVAVFIDGDKFQTLQSHKDENSPAFTEIIKQLIQVRSANQRDDSFIQRIFTVFPASDNKHILLLGPNADTSLEFGSHLGEVYRSRGVLPENLSKPWSSSGLFSDQWGEWLTATAPIKNSAGATVGAVVAEIPAERVKAKMASILNAALIAMGIGLVFALIAGLLVAHSTSKPLELLHDAIEKIGKGDFSTRVTIARKDEFGAMAQAVNTMAAGLEERDRVKGAFSRYVSHQVMDSVLKEGHGGIKGERRKVTVLFSDIRGFTTLSEKLPPEQIVVILNRYFDHMVDIVFKYKGTLDKFMGDGLMVIFGAPADDPYQEENAVKAAIEMQQTLRSLCQEINSTHGVEIKIGIGINSGNAIVGNIGSEKRMEYTAIGDTVNLASRLESATKEIGAEILISDYTYHSLRGRINAVKVGEIKVKGRNEAVLTYSVAVDNQLQS